MEKERTGLCRLTITIPCELLKKFSEWCDKNKMKKSVVLQILIKDLVNGHIEIGARKRD